MLFQRPLVLVVSATVVLGLVLCGIYRLKPARTEDPHKSLLSSPPPSEFVASPVRNPGYLGPQACAECHAERVKEFQQTRHFKAICTPELTTMPAGFMRGHGDFSLPGHPARFRMTTRDGKYVQETINHATSPPSLTISEIAFVYGSAGGNDEVYFTWRDGTLNELPIVWLGPQQRWGASPFDRHAGGDYSRATTIRCVECHNTWVEHVPGSRNHYGHDNMIPGVSCEVCHGPGRDHVDFHRHHPAVKEPHAIVQPAQLSRERRMDLCAQCHSNALKHRGPAFQYRPGEPLDDYYFTLHTRYPEEDHVANQTTYLRDSKCYQSSDTLTCVTCHNPHQPHSPTNAGTQSCLSCHNPEHCIDQVKQPEGVRSDCIGCHMPLHRKIQVSFQTETEDYVAPVNRYEHRIGVYPLARQAVIFEWLKTQSDPASREEAERLAKQLAQSWRKESDQRLKSHRLLAAIDACRESLRFDDTTEMQQKLQDLMTLQTGVDADFQEARWHERERRFSQAIDAFQRVLKARPNYAMAHARLGTTYAESGEKQLAREHLLAAIEIDPDEPYAPTMLGWLAYLNGDHDAAVGYYRQAEQVEPFNAPINYQMGLALAGQKRWTEAVERQKRAIEIDPNDANPFVAASQAFRQTGETEAAVKYAIRAAQLTKFEHLEALTNLADACAAANRWDDAIEATQKALEIAQPRNRQLAAQLRIRLVELRGKRSR